ncbi:MAG: hypothetical protein J6P84_03585, partial [Alphaproteobacteria bacterium]|nr:hypothetical protein [Alphaproteobacteria bacterium]
MTILSVSDIHPMRVSKTIDLLKRKQGQRKKNKEQPDYLDIVSAFDIETTTIQVKDERGELKPHSFMYVWQFQLGENISVMGRTWFEFRVLLEKIEKICTFVGMRYNVKKSPLLVCYVHNLAFEFQFLLGQFEIKGDECFFKKERKPLYCKIGNVEFRDSLALSNMSLAKFAENTGCSVRKQSGQKFDYTKTRFPWTELTEYEKLYCIDDVITLEEAVRRTLQNDNDTLYTIPLTSTGYVRRDCKKALLPIRDKIKDMLPREDEYRLLRGAMRGGNTHANRFHVGEIVEDVYSYDIRSAYPTQQLIHEFPMERYKWIDGQDMERVKRFIEKGYSVVGKFQFKSIRLRDETEPIPYLSYGCVDALNPELDNGRILSADYVECCITEIDLMIINDQYVYDKNVGVLECMVAKKGMLPDEYRNVIKNYYRLKTELKGVAGKEYELMKSKNKLNSIYGMSAQDVIHQLIELLPDGTYSKSNYEDEITLKNLFKANFPYQWGVYTTCLARLQLHLAMKQVGRDENGISKIVYCDTDSIKCIGKIDLTEINKEIEANARKWGASAKDRNGKEKVIGIWEPDGHYNRFITQGAKRYAYENDSGEVHVTVSGVTHKEHEYFNDDGELIQKTEYASEELGKLENFKIG